MTEPARVPEHEPEVPASTPAVTVLSGGERLLGVLHLPAGGGPHPTVVLLHGFPGHERNFDVAQALRRAGYAALVVHYRGSWGVGGDYSWAHVVEDAAAVLAAVRDGAGLGGEHDLDAGRVALVGHSFGGFVALLTAAADPQVRAVATMAAFDSGAVSARTRKDPAARAALVEAFETELLPLRGTSSEALVAELEAAGDAWSLAGLGPALADRPVLLVGTTRRDPVTPAEIHHRPVVEAWSDHRDTPLEHAELETDHALSDQRVTVTRLLLDFLERAL